MSYVELAVTTNFSFLRGASHPGDFVARAHALGYPAIGIADRNSLAGVVRAYAVWKTLDEATRPRLLIGARLVFRDGTPDILAYPKNRKAYGRLSRLLSIGKLRADKGECLLDFADLLEHRRALLLIVMPTDLESAKPVLRDLGPDTWLAASMLYTGEDRRRLRDLQQLSRQARVPLIAVNDALYHHPGQRELQDVLTCIREHVTLKEAGKRLQANAERHLKPASDMARLFRQCPDAVAQTLRFAGRISFTLAELGQRYPREPVPRGKSPDQHLRDLTRSGASVALSRGRAAQGGGHRGKGTALHCRQRDRALLPHRARHCAFRPQPGHPVPGTRLGRQLRGVLCPGGHRRRSGRDRRAVRTLPQQPIARSRPTSTWTSSMSGARKSSSMSIAATARAAPRSPPPSSITAPRSAIREVGKVFGLSEDVTGKLADTVWGHHGDELEEHQVRQGEADPANAAIARAVDFANKLMGFPPSSLQHVGGFVLARYKLDWTVPIGPAAMKDRYFIEWDKDDLDTLAIMKVDVLALGMLTCIRKAFDLIHAASPGGVPKLSLATVPQNDDAVYDMLCNADAIGVFQVESRAQMNMLPRLRPRTMYDLTVEVAIVRPGPIQGGMVHPYLKTAEGSLADQISRAASRPWPGRRALQRAGKDHGRAPVPGTSDAAGHRGGAVQRRGSQRLAPRHGDLPQCRHHRLVPREIRRPHDGARL